MSKPYIKSLNSEQLKLLLTIYSLRFSSRSVLADYLGVANNTSLYSRLQILQKHGFIASHYDKTYKLAGREAEFYLLPKGLKMLEDAGHLEVADTMVSALYKDKSVSRDFIQQQVLLAQLRNKLISTNPNLQIFTKRDTQALDYFPSPRPDLFLSMKSGEVVSRFFLEYIPANIASSKLRSRLRYLSQYHNQNVWEITNTPFPGVLIVAENGLTEANVRRSITREQYDSDTEITYYTTTQSALLAATPSTGEIWTSTSDRDQLLSLPEL